MRYILLLLLICHTSQAITVEDDKIAHFGVAFGMTKLGRFITEEGFGLTKGQSVILTTFTMSIIIMAHEWMKPGAHLDWADMNSGFLGVLTGNLINIKIDL